MARASCGVHIEKGVLDEDGKLVVVQFPAMTSQFDNDPDTIDLSIKPKTTRLRLVVESGAQRNAYVSTKNNIDDSQLFVCKRINDRLICVPVSHICTMRSDFSHLNPKEEIDPREEVRPVSVKFASNDRYQSPTKHLTKDAEIDDSTEVFRSLLFKPMKNKFATSQRELLFGKQIKVKPELDHELKHIKPDVELLPDVKPKVEKIDVDDVYSSSSLKTQIKSEESDLVMKRVKECLTKAKLVSFGEVYQFLINYPKLPTNYDDASVERTAPNTKDILDALNEYAVLVQGNWAVKSEVLYGDSGVRECTDVTGIPINLFTSARDLLLWSFNQNRTVSRPQYSKRVKIPDHDVLELFNQLAIYKSNTKKWELKLPTDKKFLSNFPDVVQRQTTFWKVRKANKLGIFNK